MRTIAITVLTLSAITSALSYDGKLIHPQCTEENGVRHCEVPSEEATPTTPIKPHEQLSPQASQNSDVPQRQTNDIRKLQFPKDLQFHYDNRSVTINFGDNYCSHPPLIHHRWADEARRIAANIAKL